MLSLEMSSSHVSPHHHHHTPWFARPVPPRRGAILSPEDETFYPYRSAEEQQQQYSLRKGKSFAEKLPKDPRYWNREDVQNWIQHMSSAHGLPSIEADRFLMNGKALCLMTMDMFCQRVPLGGKMLYKDFQLRLCSAMYSS
eukprot:TRINITY_DN5978_c0_g1_i1.p1 TRINITY_DN5978_c0_g1~~TRINITY_DN5978_c0_g1_i1.p1  ORF type:complete len:141 (+),score=44.11 TRINITY_DN5978_c0_g1_i1:365-787(+)